MTIETEQVVDEQPATHRRKVQVWVFAVLGALVVFLLIDLIPKLARGQGEQTSEAQPVVPAGPAPQDSEAEFRDRLKSEEARRLREARKAAQPAAKPIVVAQAAPTQAAAPTVLRDEPRVTDGPDDEWLREEAQRVWNSRRTSMKVKVVDAQATRSSAAPPLARASPGLNSPSANQRANTGSIDPKDPRARETAIASELERVRALRASLSGGDSGALAAVLGQQGSSGSSGSANSSGLTEVLNAALESPRSIPTAAERPGRVVGNPSTEVERLPGQVQISVGTVARAVLDQQVMSDYQGPFRGMLMDDIYDVGNRNVVVPKGTRVVGRSIRVSNINEPIQARMGLLIDWLVLPDGSKISMKRSVALDATGVAAIKDKVNRHLLAQFLGVAAYAVLSSETSRSGTGEFNDDTFAGDLGEAFRDQFRPLAQKYLNLVPTITLRPGTPLRIFFEEDIYAYPWRDVGGDVISQSARITSQ